MTNDRNGNRHSPVDGRFMRKAAPTAADLDEAMDFAVDTERMAADGRTGEAMARARAAGALTPGDDFPYDGSGAYFDGREFSSWDAYGSEVAQRDFDPATIRVPEKRG